MAHKKGGGSTRNGRDPKAKRLGVKVFGNAAINAGSIIVRQRGTQFHAGNNVGTGKDYTLYALVDGTGKFEVKGACGRHYDHIEPTALLAEIIDQRGRQHQRLPAKGSFRSG